jgi:hypothetical protein
MAAKKKTKKKHAKLKKPVVKQQRRVAKLATKKSAPKKRSGKKPALKKTAAKATPAAKKTSGAKTKSALKSQPRGRHQKLEADASAPEGLRPRAAGQSGDLQGLSNLEAADSESVDELLEEGNAFEADVIAGVESAGRAEGKEVHTHEVPQDDVPGEYLDED